MAAVPRTTAVTSTSPAAFGSVSYATANERTAS